MRSRLWIDRTCFVLMPLKQPFLTHYEHVIKPAGMKAGLEVKHGKELHGGGKSIIQDVWNSILRAQVVIADVTGCNSNVIYELGLCHAVGVPTILITQSLADVPFDYKHLRLVVYTGESDLESGLTEAIAATIEDGGVEGEIRWPYEMIEAGLNVGRTKYRYADVVDDKCEYLLLTGTNFGDQLGSRNMPVSALYDRIVGLLHSNEAARVHLVFASPVLLRKVNPTGYRDLILKSLPRMWDLAVDPRLAFARNRFTISCHDGALFMAVFVRDPDDPLRALIVTTPRWISDTQGFGRMFLAVWRRDNPHLFDALWRQISPNLRTHERANLTEVIEQIDREFHERAPGYADFVQKNSDWQAPEL